MSEIQPAYEINMAKASSKTFDDFIGLDEIKERIDTGWIVLWQHHAVHLGEIKEGVIVWANDDDVVKENITDHFVRLRAFNTEKEYHFWKSGDDIKGRLIEDNSGTADKPFADTNMVLRGVIAEQQFFKLRNMQTGDDEKLTIRTCNYITETGQAGYVDSRFVKFEIKNEKNEKRNID
jgi:hypothetical protein